MLSTRACRPVKLGSLSAKALLADWDASREKFVKVYPHEYKRALTEMAAAQKEAA